MTYAYTMRYGDEGQEVARLQRALRVNAVFHGTFCRATTLAVCSYQRSNGLKVDGIAGPDTLTSLGQAVAWGVDLSRWNGDDIDYVALRAAGCGFVYLKATQGSSYKHTDWYLRQVPRVVQAGLPFGAYHFGTPASPDPEAEAAFFVETVEREEWPDLPSVLDVEDRHVDKPVYLVEFARRWRAQYLGPDLLDDKANCPRVILYGGQSMIEQEYDPETVPDLVPLFGRWVPRYIDADDPGDVSPWTEWDMWQFAGTEQGLKVPGVRGPVDVNCCRGGWLADVLGV